MTLKSQKNVSIVCRILVLFAFLVLSGCGMGRFRDLGKANETSQSSQSVFINPETFIDRVESIQFFKGGFSVSNGDPTWSHDMNLAVASSGRVDVTAKATDPVCVKARALDVETRDRLATLIRDLKFDSASPPTSSGQGVEVLTIDGRRGEHLRIHLLPGEVPTGEFVASNGAELATLMKTIETQLTLYCQ